MYTNQYYRSQFTSNTNLLDRLIGELDRTLINTKPTEKKWCIGEVVDHLLITGGRYLEVLETALKENPELLQKGDGPYTHSLLLRYFIKVVSPEFKPKIPTLAPFVPHEHMNFNKELLLDEFEILNNRFLCLVDLADSHRLDLGSIKVGNPIYPFWKMSVSSCFAVNEAHQRRHFRQIQRILNSVS